MEQSTVERVLSQIQTNIHMSNLKNQEALLKKSENKQNSSSYKCSKCKDTGWILKRQERGQPTAYLCDCRKEERIKTQWKNCGINPEMINYKFSNFNVWNESSRTMKEAAQAYHTYFDNIRNDRRNSILLCGQVGSGKSHLSIALAINFLKRKINVLYMPYRDVITKIKQKVIDQEQYKKLIMKYQLCEVLLIDDLFKGKVNESDINIMFEIINYRYLNRMPIIVSSEFTIDKLLSFDEGVGSRIYEMCKDYVVEIDKDLSNNYRLK